MGMDDMEGQTKKRKIVAVAADSKTKTGETSMELLPKELISDILLQIPAIHLQSNVRRVRKGWTDMVRKMVRDPQFVHAHFHQSEPGTLFQRRQARLELRQLAKGSNVCQVTCMDISFPGKVLCSYDGVLLFHRRGKEPSLFVCNPITKEVLPCTPPSPAATFLPGYGSCVTRIFRTGEFKVVCCSDNSKDPFKLDVYAATVCSEMSWKRIGVLPASNGEGIVIASAMDSVLVAIDSIAYWISDHVQAIDLDKEVIHEVQATFLPRCRYASFCNMNGQLCFTGFQTFKTLNCTRLHVWILKDFRRSEWCKLYDVPLNFELPWKQVDDFRFVGWLDDNKALVYKVCMSFEERCRLLAYNVETGRSTLLGKVNLFEDSVHLFTPSFFPLKAMD